MKKTLVLFSLAAACSVGTAIAQGNQPQGSGWGFQFVPGTLVVSRSVYEGKASTVTIGESLPFGCEAV
jgi:hypothetical protein